MVIVNPLKEYKDIYKLDFEDNTKNMFENLVNESKVNEEENVATVKKYEETMANKQAYEKKLSSKKIQRTIGIIASVIGLILIVFSILSIANLVSLGLSLPVEIVLIVAGLILIVVPLVVIFTYLNKKIKELKAITLDLQAKAQEFLNEAYAEMSPLNNLFSFDMTSKLIHETLPMVSLNRYLDNSFNNYMEKNFGYAELDDPNRSTFDLITGKFYNAPFVIERNLSHEMGTKRYDGSLTISWEEEYTDSEGHTHTRTKTQTLHASVVKPFPEYYDITSTMLLSDACPNLNFTREPKLKGGESEKKLDKIIRRGEKKIDKLAKEALKTNDDFAGLNNVEFDVLFNALNRDNEREFNLLFSPAAQHNLTDIIKSDEPYGDDFHYHKNGKFNILMSEHMQEFDIKFNESRFKSYDIRKSRETFNSYNNDFFKRFYFELAPLFSIPLIQDYAQKDYKYLDAGEKTCSIRTATALANYLVEEFRPNDADTYTILKLENAGREGKLDKFVVTGFAYRGEPRRDYVSEYGDDGRYHDVPVDWVEYIPTYSHKYLWVADLWENSLEENEFLSTHNIEKDLGIDTSKATENCGLIAFTSASGTLSAEQIEKFNSLKQ